MAFLKSNDHVLTRPVCLLWFPQNQTLTQDFISWVGFPSGSHGKESAFNAGTPGSIPVFVSSLEKGNGNPLQ